MHRARHHQHRGRGSHGSQSHGSQSHGFRGGSEEAAGDSGVAYFTYPTIRGGSFVVAAEYADARHVHSPDAGLSGGGAGMGADRGAYFTLPDPDGLDGGFDELDSQMEDEDHHLYGGRRGAGRGAGRGARRGAGHGGAGQRGGHKPSGRGHKGHKGAGTRGAIEHHARSGSHAHGVHGGAGFSDSVEAGVGAAGELFFTVPVLGGGNLGGGGGACASSGLDGEYDDEGDDGHNIFGG